MIPLDDPIWKRLYGPYGIADVPAILTKLDQGWDDALAKVLIWEKLFHQDSIYPVTYAAIPHLMTLAQRNDQARRGILCDLSVLITSILRPAPEFATLLPDETYRGLPRRARDHQHDWIPAEDHLTEDDETALTEIETAFDAALPTLAQMTAQELTATGGEGRAACLLAGVVAAFAGDHVLPHWLDMYENVSSRGSMACDACGEYLDYVLQGSTILLPNGAEVRAADPGPADRASQRILARLPAGELANLVAALAELRTCPYCSSDLRH